MVDGSYTIEASIVLPLVLTIMALAISMMQILSVQWHLSHSLQKSVREMALWSDAELERTQLMTVCNTNLSESGMPQGWISGGWMGLDYHQTEFTDDEIRAQVSCRVNSPVLLLGRHAVTLHATAYARRWTGWNPNEHAWDGKYVYITPDGTAYHADASCAYLNPGIHSVARSRIDRERNYSGHRYASCRSCHASRDAKDYVYVTYYGQTYHSSLSCSGLKRTIHRVRLMEAKGYHACQKCMGN